MGLHLICIAAFAAKLSPVTAAGVSLALGVALCLAAFFAAVAGAAETQSKSCGLSRAGKHKAC
ncbi:hypothetical protein C5750_24815 [Phyllobacterium myrsinacearum]|uniref:Uncharacterized protein n=1 Tax=Phyllobacterium myrsinacearum TaxID=28101 RepID=A0A2S9JA61_9HYPH|nr:hypothetical protein C5750_24815 [Phyllobacterium myrsinacearum]